MGVGAGGGGEGGGGVNLTELQDEVGEWARRNFGPSTAMGYGALLGAVEEIGELAHHHLKQVQGIRGTPAEHEAAAQDAIADTIIYLADYCHTRGFDFQRIVEKTWARVRERDWTRNKVDGGSGSLSLHQQRVANGEIDEGGGGW